MKADVLLQLCSRVDTPFYCYDLDEVAASCAQLFAVLPSGSDLFYSVKANPHPLLIRTLYELGCRIEISSLGEMRAAQQAGVAPNAILYTGPGKSAREIESAIDAGLTFFAAESWLDLERLDAHGRRLETRFDVILRLNPDVLPSQLGITMVGVPSQFGFEEDDLVRNRSVLKRFSHLAIRGFQIYYGSQVFESEKLCACFEAGVAAAARLAATLALDMDYLDLGGGFGAPFAKQGPKADLGGISDSVRASLARHGLVADQIKLAFESGRYLVATSGQLVTAVEQVKPSKGKNFVVLDAGVNHLGGMSGLGRLPKLDMECIPLKPSADVARVSADVVGPLCTPLDCLGRGVQMPSLTPGDVVAIPNVGAYGMTASLALFLSRPLPAEVTISGRRVVDCSRATLVREVGWREDRASNARSAAEAPGPYLAAQERR